MIEISVAGGALAIACAGAGAPLVFLHGWTLDGRAWGPQTALADRFRLIVPDRRGFGRSTAPFDIEAETDDLIAVRAALGLERMILIGMSQGGRVALRFAHRHPELVAGLVLQGAALDGFHPEPTGADEIPLSDYRALARAGRLDEIKAHWSDHTLMHGVDTAELLADYDGRDLLPDERPAEPMADKLGAISAPALVLTGEEDVPWRQLVADALAYGMPNARRERLPGGHLCNLSHAAAYNARIAAFAAEVAQRQ